MTDPRACANFLVSGISFLGIAFTVLFLISDYRLDAYRQTLFELRDKLFDLGLKPEITFDHPAYRHLNLQINSLLRYAHKTKLSLFMTHLLLSKLLGEPENELQENGAKSLRTALEGLRRYEQFQLINISDNIDRALVSKVLLTRFRVDRTDAHLPEGRGTLAPNKLVLVQAVESQAMKSYRLDDLSRPAVGSY